MSTQQLLERRNRLLGKGAPLFYDEPLHIVKGEGVWLYDADGKRYLDVYNNVPNVGHCHPHVVKAIADQAAQLNIHTRYLHEAILDYGEKLTSLFDESLSMLFLACTGSEANEVALRMARNHTGAKGIICTNATYHGNTTAVDALATLFNDGKPKGPYVSAVDHPCTYRPLNGLTGEQLVDAYVTQIQNAIDGFNASGDGFAGILICPIFANEGLSDVPAGYFERVAKCVRDAGGVVIFDEVQSAFGRTGNMWGYQSTGVVPDIVTLGKPMGNGHPISAAICSAELCNEFRNQEMYFNTFGGNPVSCAAGMAVLQVIESENLVENAREVGNYLRLQLAGLQDKFELIGDIRNSGLFFGVDLVTDKISKSPATDAAHTIINRMKERGVLISRIGVHDNILKIRPPISFSRDNVDLLIENLAAVMAEL